MPLQKLSQNLADKYGIVLSEEANRFLVNHYGLDPTIDHYNNYINNAIAKGLSPHIFIPNLNNFVQSNPEQEEDGMLNISYNSAKGLNIENVVNYQLYIDGMNHFSSTRFSQNNFVDASIEIDFPCENPVMFISYRIVNMIDFSPCDGLNNSVLYNCVFHESVCKICTETQPHNNTVNIINKAEAVGAIEMRINLNRVSPDNICFNYNNYNPKIFSNKQSFGFLATVPNLDYYHPLNGTSISNHTNVKNKIIRKPITFINLETDVFYDVNQISLCEVSNDFRVFGDAPNENILGAGIYKITRLNGLPYYFVFPGNIYGSMMFNSGADGIVEYNLNGNESQVCNNQTVRSLQEEMNITTLCRFCGPTNNSLGIEYKDVASNDLNTLVDFWYGDALSVGIVLEAVNSRTPNQNIITFQGGLTPNTTCISPPPNKTLVAELTKIGDEFDQLKYFTINNNLTFYNAGTSFYIEADVTFLDGKFINSCGIITAATNFSNAQLKAAAIFPRGNLSNLNVKIYKIN